MPVTFAVRGPVALPGGPWSPASLGANLVACWDADAGVAKTGNDVTVWTDQSSNAYSAGLNTLGTSGAPNSPVYSATSYGGKPGITFSGFADGGSPQPQYLSTGANAVAFGTNVSSWFVAGMFTNGGAGFNRMISFDSGGGADFDNATSVCAILRDSTTQSFNTVQNSVAATSAAFSAYDTAIRFGMVFNNTVATPYLNNVAQATTAMSFTLGATGRISIGNGMNANANLGAPIRRILVMKSVATSQERSDIDTWLQG